MFVRSVLSRSAPVEVLARRHGRSCYSRYQSSGTAQDKIRTPGGQSEGENGDSTGSHDSKQSSSGSSESSQGFFGSIRSVNAKWGFVVISIAAYAWCAKHPEEVAVAELALLRRLPTRALSRGWGWLCSREVPESLRSPLFSAYSRMYGVNLDDIDRPLTEFLTLSDFFSRPLKPGARPIQTADLISPVDGVVMSCGPVGPAGLVHHVKGITYSVDSMLGHDIAPTTTTPPHPPSRPPALSSSSPSVAVTTRFGVRVPNALLPRHLRTASSPVNALPHPVPSNHVYHVVLYLGPGDYHRIHAPAPFQITRVRHFPGHLLSVSEYMQKSVPHLFAINERVVLAGPWRHGQMTLTAVGAYNVGSIRVNAKPDLTTNSKAHSHVWDDRYPPSALGNPFFDFPLPSPLPVAPGAELASFLLGSTVVLVFSSPPCDFEVAAGDRVQVGQRLAAVRL